MNRMNRMVRQEIGGAGGHAPILSPSRAIRAVWLLRVVLILFLLSISVSCLSAAGPRVQFSRQVLPLLKRECMVCHSGPAAPNGYSMETAERLVAGGRHGAAVLPGKGGQSNMVRYLLGQLQPQMP